MQVRDSLSRNMSHMIHFLAFILTGSLILNKNKRRSRFKVLFKRKLPRRFPMLWLKKILMLSSLLSLIQRCCFQIMISKTHLSIKYINRVFWMMELRLNKTTIWENLGQGLIRSSSVRRVWRLSQALKTIFSRTRKSLSRYSCLLWIRLRDPKTLTQSEHIINLSK